MFNTISRIRQWFKVRALERKRKRVQEGYDFARNSYFKREYSGAELRRHVQESKDFGTYDDFDRGVEHFLADHKGIGYMFGREHAEDE